MGFLSKGKRMGWFDLILLIATLLFGNPAQYFSPVYYRKTKQNKTLLVFTGKESYFLHIFFTDPGFMCYFLYVQAKMVSPKQ